MRLILEKNEIVAILGRHFEVTLDPEKVIIKTDPFEIEVSGIPMGETPPKEETNVVSLPTPEKRTSSPRANNPAPKRDDDGATTEPPSPGDDGLGSGDVDVHPSAVLAASKELEKKLEQENPQLKRRSGQGSTKPPEDFKNEIE